MFQTCPKYTTNREVASGIWIFFLISRASIIAKYHVQVMLLFVYDRGQEILVTHKRFLFRYG